MHLSTLLSLSLAASSLTTAKTWKFESCNFENLDKCAQIVMLFGARSLVIPDNERDMVRAAAFQTLAVHDHCCFLDLTAE